MSKPFDATLKTLVETYPEDWLAQAGLKFAGTVDVIDADLSTVTTQADKLVRVNAPVPSILHVELQADKDEHLDRRVLKYNVLAFDRHELPVHSLVVLLRRAADNKNITGTLRLSSPLGGDTLVFRYQVIRVWEEPPETFLNGGLGLLALAAISNVAQKGLPGVIKQISDRIDREAEPEQAKVIWTSTYILAGLRHSVKNIQELFQGVVSMRSSSTYQAILKEGRVEEARHFVLMLGEERFGKPPVKVRRALGAVTDADRLEQMGKRVLSASSWDELIASA